VTFPSSEPMVGGDFEFFEFCNDVIFGFSNFNGLCEFGCHFFFLGFFNVVMRYLGNHILLIVCYHLIIDAILQHSCCFHW